MGRGLIFPRLPERDEGLSLSSLSGLGWRARGFQETAPALKTVPETDTGGLVEHTQALERTVLKELGKMPPKLRDKGAPLLGNQGRGAQSWGWRLFTKNTGPCEAARRRKWPDPGPVPQGNEEG